MSLDLTEVSLRRAVRLQDLDNRDCKERNLTERTLSSEAWEIVNSNFHALKIEAINIRGGVAQSIRSTPHVVVLRCLSNLVREAAKLEPADRDTVVRRLVTVLSEGVHHRVYKFDVRSFFESIDARNVCERLLNERKMPRTGSLILREFFNELYGRGLTGLPRGMQISATLSEYAMNIFDEYVSGQPEVYFYARYVDDIIIVTGARERIREFTVRLRNKLPVGLSFNVAKTKILDLPIQHRSDGKPIIGSIDYLGYNLAVHETKRIKNRHCREIDVEIAPKKLRRIKTRLSCAIASFVRNQDISILEQRLQLLTGNYNIRDVATGRIRNVGLYCNYRRVNSSDGLRELDGYLRSIVMGSKSKLARDLEVVLSRQERRDMLRFGFENGFNKKIFYNFSPESISHLSSCWQNA